LAKGECYKTTISDGNAYFKGYIAKQAATELGLCP